jgi:hypothetical protein
VANQKKLEAMQVQTEIAKREAEIKVTEARGIAESNKIISGSLTREYLQHEANLALQKFAEKGNANTVIVPSGMTVTPWSTPGSDGAGVGVPNGLSEDCCRGGRLAAPGAGCLPGGAVGLSRSCRAGTCRSW